MNTIKDFIDELVQKKNAHPNAENFVLEIYDSDGFNYFVERIESCEQSGRLTIHIRDAILPKEYKYPPISNE